MPCHEDQGMPLQGHQQQLTHSRVAILLSESRTIIDPVLCTYLARDPFFLTFFLNPTHCRMLICTAWYG